LARVKGGLAEYFRGGVLALYKPFKSKREVIENILRDLDPSLREYARVVLENMALEELLGTSREELLKRLEELKKKSIK
jgi:CRP-like cAMP-binding protein